MADKNIDAAIDCGDCGSLSVINGRASEIQMDLKNGVLACPKCGSGKSIDLRFILGRVEQEHQAMVRDGFASVCFFSDIGGELEGY